jgi:hypothetical protein
LVLSQVFNCHRCFVRLASRSRGALLRFIPFADQPLAIYDDPARHGQQRHDDQQRPQAELEAASGRKLVCHAAVPRLSSLRSFLGIKNCEIRFRKYQAEFIQAWRIPRKANCFDGFVAKPTSQL